jgi:hypothetical protein
MVGIWIRGGVRAGLSLWISTRRVAIRSGGNCLDYCRSAALVEGCARYCQYGLADIMSVYDGTLLAVLIPSVAVPMMSLYMKHQAQPAPLPHTK